MDFNDFLGPTGTEGTRKTRIFTGLIGAVLGGPIGYGLGHFFQSDPASAITNGIFGALIGGGLGALFSFYVILGLVIILAVGAAVAWNIFLGGS